MRYNANGYHAMIKEAIDDALVDEPEYAAVCYQYIKGLREDTFEPELVNAIFQEWGRNRIDLYDAYLFSQIWTGLCYGEILWTTIEVGDTPLADRNHDDNNAILQSLQAKIWGKTNSLNQMTHAKAKFSAFFIGGNDIGDGYFEWHMPLSVGIVSPFKGRREIEIPPGRAPLEIGYTSVSTTMYHLNLERCLARWPYESKLIHVFYCTDDWRLIGNY